MRNFSTTNARRRFGHLLQTVRQEPVTISRRNRQVAIVVSADEYARLLDAERRQLAHQHSQGSINKRD
jgi:prevent-host-death family protein